MAWADLQHALSLLFQGLTLVALGYYGLTVVAALHWRRSATPGEPGPPCPPVSVLRPVKGLDAGATEAFSSFCRQDYPEYELLFGVLDADDPALPVLRRLQDEHPKARIRLVVGSPRVGSNLKACNLAGLAAAARHDLLVHCDSDMQVEPDFLRRVTAPLRAAPDEAAPGLVTCLYRGVQPRTLADSLEALGISTEFIPSVLVSRLLRPVDFALGSALALKRDTLEAIGGFEGVADYLADDYQVGHRVRRLGKRVIFSDVVLQSVLTGQSAREVFARRLRWARTVRVCSPGGYRGEGVTHGTTLALLGVLLAPASPTAGWLLAAVWVCRLAQVLAVSVAALGDRPLLRRLWLLPFSDLLNAGLWALGLFGTHVTWRGARYRIHRDGRFEPLD